MAYTIQELQDKLTTAAGAILDANAVQAHEDTHAKVEFARLKDIMDMVVKLDGYLAVQNKPSYVCGRPSEEV